MTVVLPSPGAVIPQQVSAILSTWDLVSIDATERGRVTWLHRDPAGRDLIAITRIVAGRVSGCIVLTRADLDALRAL